MSVKRALRLLVILALQAAVVLALLEVGLRLLRPHHRGLGALLYRATTETDFSVIDSLPELLARTPAGYRPCVEEHGYVLNSSSFRTPEYEVAKPAGAYRVLLIGDSFTYGVVPQADHWATALAQGLSSLDEGEPEVLNLGVPGTGTPFQLRLWEIEGRRLSPDLVVLGFFVGNDFLDELGNSPGWQGLSDRLALASYTYRALRNLLRLGRGRRGGATWSPAGAGVAGTGRDGGCGHELAGFPERFRGDQPTMAADLYAEIEAERMSLCLKAERWKFDLRLDRLAPLLRQLSEEVEEAGARLVVLLIPDELQVDPEVRAQAAAAAGRELEEYDLDLPQRELVRFFEANGIQFVDLLPDFRRRARDEALYIPRDSHWNRAGNRLAAERLLDLLRASRGGPGPDGLD